MKGGVAAVPGNVALTRRSAWPVAVVCGKGWTGVDRAGRQEGAASGGSVYRAGKHRGTTLLGPWYATVLFWRPRAALLVNEMTLLPVLLPLARVATLTSRIAEQISTALTVHKAPAAFVDQERQHMQAAQLGVTANRSVVGVMTEFARLAEIHHHDDPTVDLVELAVRLAVTPCSPLFS
ncbi:DUF6933 domain-containing protein [Amycolatopsis thermoflava]|uniref:DUF6933 domain-containing protein n=1 Tax=Amycolatopsis thermoflava TaxID=84480 RepID=UPI00364D0316